MFEHIAASSSTDFFWNNSQIRSCFEKPNGCFNFKIDGLIKSPFCSLTKDFLRVCQNLGFKYPKHQPMSTGERKQYGVCKTFKTTT